MAAKGRAGGVLPINAAVTKKEKSGQGQAKSSPRNQGPRLRLIIRRLPPGLTEAEFWAALGEEWHVGKSKVDWAAFKEGKVSQDPAKPSRPARSYLKVKDQSLLDELSAKVRQTPFQDAKNSTRDPCLLGPPSLEFAPYTKLASGRVRNDGRQGTIDQDQEFIDFLQSLTEPITKGAANGTDADSAHDKVTTTPLVQYLKEKKANKAKDAAEKKNSKARQQEPKEGKQTKAEKSTVVVKGSTNTTDKAKLAKASQETVKAINKTVAALQTKQAATPDKTEGKPAAKATAAAPQSAAKKERERGSAAAAARMVQRDLGLSPRTPRSSRTASAAQSTTPATTAVTPSKLESVPAEKAVAPAAEAKTPTASTPAPTPPTGPRSTRNNAPAATSTPTGASATKATPTPRAKATPQPSPGAKAAFLKHANPSQGVTEDLLRAAFSTFGTVTRCEIDKKKGLGYVDFEDADSLRKAMASSPVKVGEKGGQVVVLENRNMVKGAKPNTQKGASGPAATAATAATAVGKADATPTASPKTAAAAPASTTTQKATAQTPKDARPATPASADTGAATAAATAPSEPAAAATPPTAPRGNASRGGANARGGRGGQRGGFRGRGRGRGAGAAASAGSTATSTPAAPGAASGGAAEPK